MKDFLLYLLYISLFLLKGFFWRLYWSGKLAEYHIRIGDKARIKKESFIHWLEKLPQLILAWIVIQGFKRGLLPKELMMKLVIAGLVVLVLAALSNSTSKKLLSKNNE